MLAALDRMQAAAGQATACLPLACHSPILPGSPQLERPVSPRPAETPAQDGPAMGLDVFFATPPPPAITLQPEVSLQPQTRRRRTYDMSKVRRSARLASKPAIPAMKKVQLNLCHQLGFLDNERVPIKQVLIDYINMYSGPLPQHIVAALSTFFGIHDEFTMQLDEAMMELAGVGIDDVQEVTNDNEA